MKYTKIYMLILLAAILSCSDEDRNPVNGTNQNTDWKYGSAQSYDVNSASAVTVVDDITGYSFFFPEGGNGVLEIRKIKNGPSLEFDADQFEVNYDGAENIYIQVSKNEGEEIALFGHFQIGNTVLDGAENYLNWWEIPAFSESGESVLYDLQGEWALSKEAQPTVNINKFAVSRLSAGSTLQQKKLAIRTTVAQCIDEWLNNLPAGLKSSAQTQINGDRAYRINWSNDGNAYVHGNNWISSNANFYFTQDAQLPTIAHEVGHYMHHVLCGYEEYNAMYERFPRDFWGAAIAHDIGDYREGRDEILEDVAQFSQFMIVGDVDNYDPLNIQNRNSVHDLCNQKDPDEVDFPSHEAYGVWMLASLLRTNNEIYTFRTNLPKVAVPVVGAPICDVLHLIASGPDNTDELREFIYAYLLAKGGDYQYMLPALLEPIGWSYNGFGYILDENDQPVDDAVVISVCKVGAKEYYTRKSTETGSNGKFYLDRIFPGANYLRVYTNNGHDSTDFNLVLDWEEMTNTTLELGNFKISNEEIIPILHRTHEINAELYLGGATEVEMEVTGQGISNYSEVDTTYSYTTERTSDFEFVDFYGVDQSITWSGTSFSSIGEYEEVVSDEVINLKITITGSVSSDGKTLLSAKQEYIFTRTYERETGYYGGYERQETINDYSLEFKNIPIDSYDEGSKYVEYKLPDYINHTGSAVISYSTTESMVQVNQYGNYVDNWTQKETFKKFIPNNNNYIRVGFN
ncbi:MAG: hypothetical protein JXQ65_12415 [Candidatus Marinimicrobia bacterium]|nr:hypothetical protein [Candidatus Neomarinimicrobiota bacterium]